MTKGLLTKSFPKTEISVPELTFREQRDNLPRTTIETTSTSVFLGRGVLESYDLLVRPPKSVQKLVLVGFLDVGQSNVFDK